MPNRFQLHMRVSVYLVLISLLSVFTQCSQIRQRSSILSLDRTYIVKKNQPLYFTDTNGHLSAKQLTANAPGVLFERNDTLFVELIGNRLPPTDSFENTLDRADSATVFFTYQDSYSTAQFERSTPWFTYQFTSFDIDLFTIPFKYRFSQPQLPGQLVTNANLGIYFGLRHDIGQHRTTYFRHYRRSDLRSFSFGGGGFLSFNSNTLNDFYTNGKITYEYEALGYSYGLAGILGYKALTVGIALGFENLADRNNPIWVYRQKPWLGLTVGLNLN